MKARTLTRETILNYGIEERNFPDFNVGDTIEVAQVVKEGNKERIQNFRGDVMCLKRNSGTSTFTVRKIGANGIGVERIFPYYSKNVSKVTLIKKGKVRRAKINYLRERVGRAARVKEKILTKEQKAALNAAKTKTD